MKIVLTLGHPDSGYALAHEALAAAGLAQARPSRREAMTAAQWHEAVCKAHGLPPAGGGGIEQLAPGRVWQDLAVDLFLGNLDGGDWGFADARAVWLLDFWREFDAQLRFVLAYSPPEHAAGRALLEGGEAGAALAGWAACNEALLAFYHRNPGRCLLVNAEAAAGDPAGFVEKAAEALGLDVGRPPAGFRPQAARFPALAARLAGPLAEACREARALQRELESAADLGAPQDGGEGRAWQEYLGLLEGQARAAALAGDNKRLEDGLARARREAEQGQARAAALAGDNQRLQDSLAQARREADKAAALAGENGRLQDLLRQAEKQLETRPPAPAPGRAAAALAEENKLLLLQLHQVQEELEHYFLKSQEKPAWQAGAAAPAGLVFDLRRDFDGENWYYAERDGRWAGPEAASAFKSPALGAGEYELEIEIVDAMEPGIVDGMQASVNGRPFPLKVRWRAYPEGVRRRGAAAVLARVEALLAGTPLAFKSKQKRYPVRAAGRFAAPEGAAAWEFRLQFPKLVSPSERGSDDQRRLAVRVRSLKLLPVG